MATSDHEYDAIIEAMGFEMVDNGIIEYPTSVPATLTYDGEPDLDYDALVARLDEHDFGTIGPVVKQNDDGEFYFRVKVLTDHCKEVIVKGWQEEVKLYHRDDHVDTFEISRIVHAVEDAVGCGLVFNPDHDDDTAAN